MVREFLFLSQDQQATYPLREDLRCEISKQQLVGWTIDLIKSILPELILKYSNREEFMEALKDKTVLQGKDWKEYLRQVIEDPEMKLKDVLSKALDDKYKEKISDYTKDMDYKEIDKLIQPYGQRIKQFFSDPNNKALCQSKAAEPHEWLKARGKVPPGKVGSTAELPGFFCGIDHGTVEFLAQKDYMHEYYFHGNIFNGKFIFRLLARTKKWQKAGKRRQIWMFWRTKEDDLPYVLKKRAVDKGWMPPEGKSALPKYIRDQVPKGYEYWKAKGAKAKELRDELSKAIRGKRITIKTIKEMIETAEQFQFKRLWWKGPTVIRGMPQLFYILLFHDKTIHHAWHFTENILYEVLAHTREAEDIDFEELPIEEYFKRYCGLVLERLLEAAQTIPLDEKDYKDNRLIQKEGKFPPEHPLNPNKELPLFFDTIDKGKAIKVAEEKERFYRYKLEGKKLKGLYVLVRQSPKSKMWNWSKAELPEPKEQWAEPVAKWKSFDKSSCLAAGGRWIDGRCIGLEEKVVKRGEEWCVVHCHPDGTIGKTIKCFPTKKQADAMHRAIMAEEQYSRYAPVAPSGKVLGKPFKPKQLAKAWKQPIIVKKDFIFITNPDRTTTGDGDVIKQMPYFKYLDRPIDFRLYRAIKASIPELTHRIHITNDPEHPFTDYLPIYDLVLVPSERKDTIKMHRQIEEEIRESFRWAKRYDIDLDRYADSGETWIRGTALFPQCSLNQRCYSREEIKKMARTAIDKPIMVNHGEGVYQGITIGKIEDADEEGGRLEFLARITDKAWANRVKAMKPDERLLSIGANPRSTTIKRGRTYPEGLVIDEISILVPPAKPGIQKASYQVLDGKWH